MRLVHKIIQYTVIYYMIRKIVHVQKNVQCLKEKLRRKKSGEDQPQTLSLSYSPPFFF